MQNGPEAMFSDWIQTLSLESSMNEIDSGKFLSPSLQRYGLGDLLLKIDRLKQNELKFYRYLSYFGIK